MKVELSIKKASNIKRIIILIPMTIPGNGKTYFINQLKPIIEKYGINFQSISSDNICCIFKIDEHKGELIGKISYEVIDGERFNSFLILNDDYIAIHTYNILLLYKTPKNINGDRPIIKKRYTKIYKSIEKFTIIYIILIIFFSEYCCTLTWKIK